MSVAPTKTLKEIIAEEYKKSAADPIHFMRRYGLIQHPQRGKVLFNLYPFQAKVLTEFQQHRFNIVLKSRQLGISTLCAAYALWCMTFKSDFNVLVIATKQDVAKNIVTKVKVMQEGLPSWLKVNEVEFNKLGVRLKNGSQIKAVSATSDAGRSDAISLLIIDEAAWIDGIEDIWTASQSTLSTGGKAIILSTPAGVGNFFHKTWQKAEYGGEWNPIKLKWDLHPERTIKWREEQDALLGPRLAAQESDCDFLTSGNSFISQDILKWYSETYVQEPTEKRGITSDYWVWEGPDYNKSYMVIADVARGDGKDFSACHVIEIEGLRQVAEYKGLIGTKEYGNMLVSIATEYNDALLIIENANIGWAVIQQAIDRTYRNLYYTYKDDAYQDPEVYYRKGYDLKDKSQMVPGFTTSSKTRPLVLSTLDMLMREKSPIIRSKRLIDELSVFIWNGQRPEAQHGYNDDLVMSWAIGLRVRDTAIKLRTQGIELSRAAVSNVSRQTGVYTNKTADQSKKFGWTQPTRDGDSDLKWLL